MTASPTINILNMYRKLKELWKAKKVPMNFRAAFVKSVSEQLDKDGDRQACYSSLVQEVQNLESGRSPMLELVKVVKRREDCLKEINEFDRALYCEESLKECKTFISQLEKELRLLRKLTILCFELILALSEQLKQRRLLADDYFFRLRGDTADFSCKAIGKLFNFMPVDSQRFDPFLIHLGSDRSTWEHHTQNYSF